MKIIKLQRGILFIFSSLLLLVVIALIWHIQLINPKAFGLIPWPNSNTKEFVGEIKKGSQIEGMEYCSEGNYLVSDTAAPILLKIEKDGVLEMLNTNNYEGKKVAILGSYDESMMRCAALMCACDLFMNVEGIREL